MTKHLLCESGLVGGPVGLVTGSSCTTAEVPTVPTMIAGVVPSFNGSIFWVGCISVEC